MVTVLGILLAVAVLVLLGAGRWRSRRRSDRRSMSSHRIALEVIEHVAGADGAPAADHTAAHVRVLAPVPARRRTGGIPDLPTRPVYERPGLPAIGKPVPLTVAAPAPGTGRDVARQIASAARPAGDTGDRGAAPAVRAWPAPAFR
jgi:type II secretory pathway pseudopilin PulG